jgi:glutathione peroxidase
MSIFDIDINALDGTPDVLGTLRGSPTLLVNVASRCGLTPQYEQLEQIHERYSGKGFSVVGVPCNQFLEQEPGTPEEIATFCSTTYGITFPLTEKIEVNGEQRHPLYEQLAEAPDAEGHTGDVRWNFEKFLVDGDGRVIGRFPPQMLPDDPAIVEAIEAALN